MSKRPAPKPPAKNSVTKQPEFPDLLREEVERQIGPLVNQGQRDQIVLRITTMLASEQFSGPIAHPRHFREYEQILPGSAERIVQMAESAQRHNRKMEEKVVDAGIWEAKAGMVLGFAALMVLVCVAAYAGLQGKLGLAALFLGAGVLGGAVTLIRGWKPGNGT